MPGMFFFTACGPSGLRLAISGSTALMPLARAAAASFGRVHPDVSVQVTGGGSFVGLYQVWSKAVDIGMADAVPPPGKYPGLVGWPVAVIPYCLVVNPDVAVASLTRWQVAEIFSGRVRDWRSISGQGLPVVVVGRASSSGSRLVLEERLLNGGKVVPRGVTLPSSGAVRAAVAATPGAIGYLEAGRLNSTVRAVALGGVPFSASAVGDGKYAFWGMGRFYTLRSPGPVVRAFLALIRGRDFRPELRRLGYLPPVDGEESGAG